MKVSVAGILVVALLFAAAAAPGKDAAPVPDGRDISLSVLIERLVAGLGSKRYDERESAELALSRIGARALPALEKAAASKRPEVRFRAKRLLSDARLGLGPDWPSEIALRARHYKRTSEEERRRLLDFMALRLREKGAPFMAALLKERDKDADAVLGNLARLDDANLALRLTEALRNPVTRDEYVALALSLARIGRTLDALRALSRADIVKRRRDQDVETRTRRLLARLREKEFDAVAEQAKRLAESNPRDAEYLYVHAEALAGLGRKDDAAKARRMALALNPRSKDRHVAAARMLLDLGKWSLAQKEWDRTLNIAPKNGPLDFCAHIGQARALAEKGKYAEAAKRLGTAFDLLPCARAAMGSAGGEAPGAAVAVARTLRLLMVAMPPLAKHPLEMDPRLDPKPERALRVAVKAEFRGGQVEDMALAMAGVEASFVVRVNPDGLRLFDIAPVTIKYDAAGKRLLLELYGSPLAQLKPFTAKGGKSRFDVRCGDCNYVFELDKAGGDAGKVARTDTDYDVTLRPLSWMAKLEDVRVCINGRFYTWQALQEGVKMDTLPDSLRVEMEGRRPSGKRLRLKFEILIEKPAPPPPPPPQPAPRPAPGLRPT